jgi:hypothetical protein
MNIYLIDKTAGKKQINLGSKIKINKLNDYLDDNDSILIQQLTDNQQLDFRIRKVYADHKKKQWHYVLASEIGKSGFDTFSPRLKTIEETKKFGSLNDLFVFLENNWEIDKRDWIIE